MTVTISGTYSGFLTLFGPFDDPATIAATGLLDAGFYANGDTPGLTADVLAISPALR